MNTETEHTEAEQTGTEYTGTGNSAQGGLAALYEGCRSYRRFQQRPVADEILREMTETARKRSSGMNAQVLRYLVVRTPEIVAKLQPLVHWAAKLPKEQGTPKAGQTPVAFILVLGPEKPGPFTGVDLGIALDTMAITAWQHGVGSCIMASIDRKKIAEIVSVPEGMSLQAVLALGYPAHRCVVTEPDAQHGLDYYLDDQENFYVPKRPSAEVIRFL